MTEIKGRASVGLNPFTAGQCTTAGQGENLNRLQSLVYGHLVTLHICM